MARRMLLEKIKVLAIGLRHALHFFLSVSYNLKSSL
jgi:hypothetical protein